MSDQAEPPRIESYRFGKVVIDGQTYTRDLIILPDRVLAGWWRAEGHNLHVDDLEAVLSAQLELLVVGQGAFGRLRVAAGTRQALTAADIELVAQPTELACQTYNAQREARHVAAALHLTC